MSEGVRVEKLVAVCELVRVHKGGWIGFELWEALPTSHGDYNKNDNSQGTVLKFQTALFAQCQSNSFTGCESAK